MIDRQNETCKRYCFTEKKVKIELCWIIKKWLLQK